MDEVLAAIDAVQPEDVDALIHRVLDEDQLSLMALGAVDGSELPRDLLRS
jgi:predicted Zn-dependent peptidase